MKPLQSALTAGCGLLVVFVLTGASSADTQLWKTDASGVFNVASNWNLTVPDADDIAYFRYFGAGTPTPYTVAFPGGPVVQGPINYVSGSLRVGPNTVSFAPSNPIFFGASTYTLNTAIEIGEPSSIPSVLSTSLQTLAAPRATIGFFAASEGTLNVNTGVVNLTGSSGNAELIVGDGGAGTMNINGGSQVNVTGFEGNTIIGNNAGVHGTVNVGAGAVWNNTSNGTFASVVIGAMGVGALNITGGGQVNDFNGTIASNTGSTGSVVVDGPGSTWTNRGQLLIGGLGPATLTISNGGQVFDDSSFLGAGQDSSGTANVSGIGSKWTQGTDLRVGSTGGGIHSAMAPGNLQVSGGGQVATGRDAFVGLFGSGTVAVGGTGSLWTVGRQLNVERVGVVGVNTGGHVVSDSVLAQGTINVGGTGSVFDVNDYIYVADFAALSTDIGMVNLSAGGQFNSRVAFVGASRGAGRVIVDGAGANWSTAEQLYVGLDGIGEFFVSGGGHAASDSAQIGVSLNSVGELGVNGPGSKWTNARDAYVGVVGTGQLTAANGGVIDVNGLLSIGPTGTLQGNSTIEAVTRNSGIVAPGLSTSFNPNDALGKLHLDGDYTQTAAGKFDVQLGSIASFDKLAINGHATLGGTVELALVSGFTPAVGNMFQILTATGGISGTFTLEFNSLSPGTQGPAWILVYSNSDVILKLVNLPPGDYNRNGTVDAADYAVWRDTLNQTGPNLPADGDGDGTIDNDDYGVWRSHFGQSIASGSAADLPSNAAVPESTTATLLLCGLGHQFSVRRRRRIPD